MVSNNDKNISDGANYIFYVFTENLVGATTYPLNPSRTKEVSIGFNRSFDPTVTIRGGTNGIQFSEAQWLDFSSIDFSQLMASPARTNWGDYTLNVYEYKGCTCLSIDTPGKQRIILARDTVKTLMDMRPLINHVIQELYGLQMNHFYQQAVETCARDPRTTVDDFCDARPRCGKARILRELGAFYRDAIAKDIQYYLRG